MEQIINIAQLAQDELIDRYLKNQMDPSEEAEFESRLRTDEELRNRARFIAQAIKAMKNAEDGRLTITPTSGFRRVAKNPLAKPKKK